MDLSLYTMDPQEIIKFCPRCRSELELTRGNRFFCNNCAYIQYISPVPCNSLVITNKAGEIILTERKNEPRAGYWDLPGGFIELNENIETSVIREAKEETNLDFKIEDLHYIVSNYNRYLYKGVKEYLVGVAYQADYPEGQILIAGDDAKSAKFFKPSEIPWDKIAFPSVTVTIKTYLEKLKPV